MKVAVVGSRRLRIRDMESILPKDVTEIVTGGAKGVDEDAMAFAKARGIPLKVFKPKYQRYGKGAPIIRNREIVDYADCVIAVWDGQSRGTMHAIEECRKQGKPIQLIIEHSDTE